MIKLETAKVVNWTSFTDDLPPDIPFGTSVEVSVSFQENDFLSGKSGIVWATYDVRQAEIIQAALIAQQISTEIKNINLGDKTVLILKVNNEPDVADAIDFIWKSSNGLRLKPDWAYPKGEKNKSFELWLSGH